MSGATDARLLLETLRPKADRIHSEVGIRDGVAFLRLELEGSPAREVAITTPGARWYSLQTEGGFSLDWVDEDGYLSDNTGTLERYVEIALAYLEGKSEIKRSRFLHLPILVIHVGDESIEINQSIDTLLPSLFRRF